MTPRERAGLILAAESDLDRTDGDVDDRSQRQLAYMNAAVEHAPAIAREVIEAEKREARLRAVVDRLHAYADHSQGCARHVTYVCTCGYRDVLAALDEVGRRVGQET